VRDSSVSVVIPTMNRPAMLLRALNSIASQTCAPWEVIVVFDGSDDETAGLVQREHPSVRLLQLKRDSGAAVARNLGVQRALGAWVAFLDDDDEWLPRKLELQLAAALRSSFTYPIVFNRVIVNTPRGRFLMPRRGPSRNESADEYLYCRRTLRPGEVFFYSSHLLVPRELLNQVEFRAGQRKWNDVDWLLRAGQVAGAGLEFLPEPLSVWNTEDHTRPTITGEYDWESLFQWAKSNRQLFSRRAYSGVLLVSVMHEAVKQRDRRAIRVLLREALRRGEPDAIQGALFTAGMLVLSIAPRGAYQWLKQHLRERLPAALSQTRLADISPNVRKL
jgi:glycosyltransferase involved in cell wall biosynthesis